jgi:magnesium transporter
MREGYDIIGNKVVRSQSNQPLIELFLRPTADEKLVLLKDFRLDETTIESFCDCDSFSWVEVDPTETHILFRMPRNHDPNDPFSLEVASVGLLIRQNKLVVVADTSHLFTGRMFMKASSPMDVALRLIYRAVNHFNDHLKGIDRITDELQEGINRSMENKVLLQMFQLQKSLVYYLNSVNSNAAVLEKLRLTASKTKMSVDEIELLDDLIIENAQCLRKSEIHSNILASLMDARASIVSNNLNILMNQLNIITIAIMVPTFVVSAFSMNVKVPLEDHPFAFVGIMGVAIFSALAFLLLWRRKTKWRL